MSLDKFKQDALDAIVAHPGSTRMEWFRHTFVNNEHRNTMWHVFKFQIAMVHILAGRVIAQGEGGNTRFFHKSHKFTQQ